MKCTACGKEFDEGFAYCPQCASKTSSTEEATSFRRLAAEEKLRDLRRGQIGWAVGAAFAFVWGISVFCTFFLTPSWAQPPIAITALTVALFVVGIVCSLLSRRDSRQRHALMKKLEQGKFE